MSDEELFTRFYYYGTVQLGMREVDFWLMPIGFFLDLWTCHKQFMGIEKAKMIMSIDDIIPKSI